ncbi:MAG: hypothetical protein JEZ06_24565 [Anaerolineaceae bacterium]|nr:hypothetical protein [Anaerolineaceae bacterium]
MKQDLPLNLILAQFQLQLYESGIIPDWNVGTNSRLCEWVEHRHWEFRTILPVFSDVKDEHVKIDALGLDYSGWVLLDNVEVARFSGALIPHVIDLSGLITDEEKHSLSIIFEEPPSEQGQIGYTSKSKYIKPRYNYSWDWCPRFVPVGVWDKIQLVTGSDADFRLESMHSKLDESYNTGSVETMLVCSSDTVINYKDAIVQLKIMDNGTEITHTEVPLTENKMLLHLNTEQIEPWWPNGYGKQKCYSVKVVVRNADGSIIWKTTRKTGFRHVEWQLCEGSPVGAEPWLCIVNGIPVFLQGANWTPIRVSYPDTKDSEYQEIINLYQEMGTTCLRVWGGGLLEKEVFYNACDEAGILIFQELPLSSSGLENEPPSDLKVIDQLVVISRTFIRSRTHHPSLLFWSGGNELRWSPVRENEDGLRPIDSLHPCIDAFRKLISEEDPGRRFVDTSPSGPKANAAFTDLGSGICHDVHGPWGLGGMKDMSEWKEYWLKDDALFRSEVGMPGAMKAEKIDLYSNGLPMWPPQGEYWLHTSSWWRQWDRLENDMLNKDIAEYVKRSQADQAEAYRFAAQACKSRFPRCGGFLIWMGHDCFPCPSNNSIIDFSRELKPAYYAIQEVFLSSKKGEINERNSG